MNLVEWAWDKHECGPCSYGGCTESCFGSALRFYQLGERGRRTYEYIQRRKAEERQRKHDAFIGPRDAHNRFLFAAYNKIFDQMFWSPLISQHKLNTQNK